LSKNAVSGYHEKSVKNRRFYSIALFSVVLLLIGIFVTFTTMGQSQNQKIVVPNLPTRVHSLTATATRPSRCVPLPVEKNISIRTPTPKDYSQSGPTAFAPTTTPIPLKSSYDFDPSIPMDQKSSVVILRCNGDWEEYWLGPGRSLTESVKLDEGDVVWLSAPPTSAMGKRPPEPTKKITVTK
jgi:hypothetical protein